MLLRIRNISAENLLGLLPLSFRACLERRKERLQMAVALSVILHFGPFLFVSQAPLSSAGGGGQHNSPQALYAVLVRSSANSENLATGTPGDSAKSELVSTPELAIPGEVATKEIRTQAPVERLSSASLITEFSKLNEPKEAGIPSVPGYLSGTGLSQRPRLLSEVAIEYPAAAGDQEGKLVLRILVSETGVIDGLAVVRSDPPGVFDEAALKAFGTAKFSPGQILGLPTKSQYLVEVEFFPTSRDNVSGRGY